MINKKNKKNYIEKFRLYKAKYKRFRVAFISSHGFWQYHMFPDMDLYLVKEETITDREVFPDEIIIESDKPLRVTNRAISNVIEKKLLKLGYGYEKYYSGNKSYHIHICFKDLEHIVGNDYRKILKQSFIKWLYGYDEKRIDKDCVDMQLCGKHLIRMEYAEHPKSGRNKILVSENIIDGHNYLPKKVWKDFKEIKRRLKAYKGGKSKICSSMNCMRFFYNNSFTECRKRILFVLYNNLREQFGNSIGEKFIREWNSSILRDYIRPKELDATIRTANKSDMCPKCGYITNLLKELGRIDVCGGCTYGSNRRSKN